MAEQSQQGRLEHCKVITKVEEKLIFIKNAIAMGSTSMNGSSVVELLCDTDLGIIGELSLCSKDLRYLLKELEEYLRNLVHLDLSKSKLKTLPDSLQFLTRLEVLTLNENCLASLPLTIMELSSLRVLELSKNSIEALPDNLGDLKHLEILSLGWNRLNNLPDSCDNLNRLKTLDISGNMFKELPRCVTKGMHHLETLDVSSNLNINISMAPASKKLKSFCVRKADACVKFPVWLLEGKAPDLQALDCDSTRFRYFRFLNDRPSLKLRTLSMENCSVHDKIVETITSEMDELETLRVGNSDFSSLDNTFRKIPIKNLKRPKLLKEISVRGTALPALCQEIGKFINLVKLDLSCNYIRWLPDEICLLSKLEVLLIDENSLNSFPENIGRMTSLTELKAKGNCIAELPESIRNLKHLSFLDLYRNDFSQAPEDLNYMQSLLGVDLDQNYFVINDLHIRDLQYETLRSNLRNRYLSQEHHRSTGPKYEDDCDELISSCFSSSTSSDEENPTVDVNENDTKVEENWDMSDMSTDEFDPTSETREPSRKSRITFTYMPPLKKAFCPADLHNPSVIQQLALRRQRGEVEDRSKVVEGQFDDV